MQKNYKIVREYICSYFCLSVVYEQQVSGDNGEDLKVKSAARLIDLKKVIPNPISWDEIDKMSKQVKNHRSSLDFDIKFCKAVMRTVGEGVRIGDSKPVSVPGRKRQKIIDIVKQEK